MGEGEAEYYSKDFEWEQLKLEIEADPSLSYHLLQFESPSSSPSQDSGAWNHFHLRHSTGNFFKERRYLLKEFPELLSCDEYSKVLEVGCGNGSTALPILRGKKNISVYACDSSTEALDRATEMIGTANVDSFKSRFHPFHCDFSVSGFPNWLACFTCRKSFPQVHQANKEDDQCLTTKSKICIGGMDFITMIFTLSAIPLHRMATALRECFTVLKPGGLVFFRDYGLYDMSMLRFEREQRVGYREYMRSDGTRSYFFSLDAVRDLFVGVGFIEVELDYCCIKSLNRKNGKSMRRVWVHGKFKKPANILLPAHGGGGGGGGGTTMNH